MAWVLLHLDPRWRGSIPLSAGEESVFDKQEWSVVQALEWRHRDKDQPLLVVEEFEGYTCAGIASDAHRSRTWLMLHPRFGFLRLDGWYPILLRRVKIMSPSRYTLSRDELDRLTNLPGTTPDATRELAKHLAP